MHSPSIRREHQLRAICSQQRSPLLAHSIRHRQNELVSLDRTYQREADSGVTRGGLDDSVARLDTAVLLRLLDHCQTDPVFDAAAWIIVLELGPYIGVIARGHAVEPHNRSMADQIERRTCNACRHEPDFSCKRGRIAN